MVLERHGMPNSVTSQFLPQDRVAEFAEVILIRIL